MKNYIKHHSILGIFLGLTIVVGLSLTSVIQTTSSTESPEIQMAELSPRGLEGGYATPASGSSGGGYGFLRWKLSDQEDDNSGNSGLLGYCGFFGCNAGWNSGSGSRDFTFDNGDWINIPMVYTAQDGKAPTIPVNRVTLKKDTPIDLGAAAALSLSSGYNGHVYGNSISCGWTGWNKPPARSASGVYFDKKFYGSSVDRRLSQNTNPTTTYQVTCSAFGYVDYDCGDNNCTREVTSGTLTAVVEFIYDNTPPECSDSIDNDNDDVVDEADPGCHTDNDPDDGDDTYDPDDDDEADIIERLPECADTTDNDGDGLIDRDDPGCHTDGDPNDGDNTYDPLDDSEEDTAASMTLRACTQDNDCVNSPGVLRIDELDEVTVSWTSAGTDFCDSVGTFNMTGNPPNGSDGVVEPDLGDIKTFVVSCGNDGTAEVSKFVNVMHPGLDLIPYPRPPIIPGVGMPPGNPATVEPVYDNFNPALCTLTGPRDGAQNLQTLITAGELTNGTYEVQLNPQGETTYTLTCDRDWNNDGIGDGDPLEAQTTFRTLPRIEET